jgi:hypothetical protein
MRVYGESTVKAIATSIERLASGTASGMQLWLLGCTEIPYSSDARHRRTAEVAVSNMSTGALGKKRIICWYFFRQREPKTPICAKPSRQVALRTSTVTPRTGI